MVGVFMRAFFPRSWVARKSAGAGAQASHPVGGSPTPFPQDGGRGAIASGVELTMIDKLCSEGIQCSTRSKHDLARLSGTACRTLAAARSKPNLEAPKCSLAKSNPPPS